MITLFWHIISGVLGAFVGLGLVIGVLWPFLGTLIRWQAHYNPKRITLGDDERGERGLLSFGMDADEIDGYWSLFRRIKRVEGLGGYWKGTGVILFFTISIIALYALFLLLMFVLPLENFRPSLLVIILFLLSAYFLYIPFRVALIRSVATSRAHSFSSPRKTYRAILFNAFERRNPLRLLLLPGVTFGLILSDIQHGILIQARDLILTLLGIELCFTWKRLLVSVLFNTILSLIITPSEVIVTRLSLQQRVAPDPFPLPRLNADSAAASTTGTGNESTDADLPPYQSEDEVSEPDSPIDYAGATEDVIQLRPFTTPYRSLLDCARTIAREEGLVTFWRGWPALVVLFSLNEFVWTVQQKLKGKN